MQNKALGLSLAKKSDKRHHPSTTMWSAAAVLFPRRPALTWGISLLLFVANTRGQDGTQQPHIVVVIADDLGWADLGYHGSEIRTPVLDDLASQGVRLEQHYAAPLCSPSRAQFLTGRHQIHTGLEAAINRDEPVGLPLDIPTLADGLRSAGYSTNLIGKWHLGMFQVDYLPTRRGFDRFYGMLVGEAGYYMHEVCTEYQEGLVCGDTLYDNEDPVRNITQYSTYLYAEKAMDIIANHTSTQPLFLVLAMQAPHTPLEMPPRYEDEYTEIEDEHRRVYAAMVTCMDESIGRVTEALKEYGFWEDTVFVFFNDNGGDEKLAGNNQPLRGGKGSLWEGGVRTPAFVVSNLLATAGSISQGLMYVTDWYPTLLSLAGHERNIGDIYGVNVWDMISEGLPSPRTEVLLGMNVVHLESHQTALRQGEWKIFTSKFDDVILHPDGTYSLPDDWSLMLYNVANDPSETTDLSQNYPELTSQLLQRLLDLFVHRSPTLFSCPDPRSNPKYFNYVWSPWLPFGYDLEPEVQYGCLT